MTNTRPSSEYAFDAAEMMRRIGRHEELSQVLWEIVRHNPRHADAWALRGELENQAGRHANAMLHYALALQAAPNRRDIWNNRGITAMNARMLKEAEESFIKSLELEDNYDAHLNYGNLLCSMMRVDEGIEQYKAALKIGGNHDAQLNANLGVALIAQGKWDQGFRAYRHRFNAAGFPPHPRLQYPKWHGEDLTNKTILLYVEQGFGDEILSLRFADIIHQKWNCEIIIAVRPPMYRLARQSISSGKIMVMLMYDHPWKEPDYMCALLDIPAYMDIWPGLFPTCNRYLSVEDRGHRLGFPPGLNVGLCWASGKRNLQPTLAETAKQKTIGFDQLAAAVARPGVNLVSLQQTHDCAEFLRNFGVHDPMIGVTDFADTAWIIDQLDLVITVDTSVAHLAGAMGKPVWNLVRFDALWPWMQDQDKTCWYDSMKLYRQTRPFDWNEPLKRVQADLVNLLTSRAAA